MQKKCIFHKWTTNLRLHLQLETWGYQHTLGFMFWILFWNEVHGLIITMINHPSCDEAHIHNLFLDFHISPKKVIIYNCFINNAMGFQWPPKFMYKSCKPLTYFLGSFHWFESQLWPINAYNKLQASKINITISMKIKTFIDNWLSITYAIV